MIVCVNTYEVPPARAEAFQSAFREVVSLLRRKPGFQMVRLHRANDDSGRFMTYAVWESLDDQRNAGKDPDLVPKMKAVLAIAKPKAEWFELCFAEPGQYDGGAN